jgi:hypothetical protein
VKAFLIWKLDFQVSLALELKIWSFLDITAAAACALACRPKNVLDFAVLTSAQAKSPEFFWHFCALRLRGWAAGKKTSLTL